LHGRKSLFEPPPFKGRAHNAPLPLPSAARGQKNTSPNKEYKPVEIREDFGKSSGRCCKTSLIKAGWLIKKE